MVIEWDDGSSLVEQFQQIDVAGLPRASVVVFTGGKSHHHYWRLDQSISIEEFTDLQKRLA